MSESSEFGLFKIENDSAKTKPKEIKSILTPKLNKKTENKDNNSST